jgi:hypothetical protein
LRAISCLKILSFLLLIPVLSWAHHPTGLEPVSSDVVVARVYTEDPERIQTLGREHDLWYYLWRQGYAVIRTDRNRLPSDAQIDHEMTAGLKRADSPFRGSGTIPARPCYRTVEQTHSDLQALALARPDLAQWVDYGDSWERQEPGGESGYDLLALVLSNQNIAGPKPVFMVMAAMHAREMSTAETAARFAELLFDGYGIDPNITWMLDYFEIHIMAQHNPDGRKMAEAELRHAARTSIAIRTAASGVGPLPAAMSAANFIMGPQLLRNLKPWPWNPMRPPFFPIFVRLYPVI